MTTTQIRKNAVLLIVSAVTAASGCSGMSNTATGAGIGGALGTAAGLGIGAATHNPKTGALVGGLAGAGLGAAVGNSADQQERREERAAQVAQAQATAATAAAAQQRVGMTDVISMTQAGQDEQVIINQIQSTGSTFSLTPSDLNYLKQCGVTDRVIMAMQSARPRPMIVSQPRTVVVREPAPVIYESGPPVVFVRPAPPPPGVVFVGGYRRW